MEFQDLYVRIQQRKQDISMLEDDGYRKNEWKINFQKRILDVEISELIKLCNIVKRELKEDRTHFCDLLQLDSVEDFPRT